MISKRESIPGYAINSVLGTGNFGVVYNATSILDHSHVAIKVMRSGNVTEEEIQGFGYVERMGSPFFLNLIDVVTISIKKWYMSKPREFSALVMPAAEGEPLDMFAAELVPLDMRQDQARLHRVFLRVFYAMMDLKDARLCHRDIKPQNVIIKKQSGRPPMIKIIDYGFLGPAVHPSVGQAGTLSYMAPELLTNRFPMGDCFATDIWALGVTLYVSLTGRLPFKLMPFDLKKIMYGNTFMLVIPESLSPQLQSLLRRMLDVNAQTRITIEQIIEHPWAQRNMPF